jgi:choline dehydrogenase-like flavoprotein
VVKPPSATDIVIVGAGAAGCLMAAELAEAGRQVVVLEAGPAWTQADLVSSQLWARRLKWSGPAVEVAANHRGFSHNLNTGWGFGGAALHHYATWPRMHEEAFRTQSLFGRGRDWPFDAAELRPWYDRVQADVGISGDARAEPWRPAGDSYPLPPQPLFKQAELLKRGFEQLELPVAPLPAAILTAEYKGRPACIYDGWCDAGCPLLALANPLASHLPRAEAAGAVFVPNAMVTRVLAANRGRARGVAWTDPNGVERTIEAEQVVLAASAIQNPRLMLASACREWPLGLGNDRDQVGRNFMLDAVALVYGLFEEETENFMGVSAGQLYHRARYGERPSAPFGSFQWQIAPSLKPNDIFGIAVTRADLFGPPLHQFMARAARHMASQVGMVEQMPMADNRVLLSSNRDRYGVPLARVQHSFDAETKVLWAFVVEEGRKVMSAAGAVESWAGPFNAGHMIGGTLVGDDPANSVADRWGRIHAIENVMLAGSGLFPGSGGVSPTYTLCALAQRSAHYMLGQVS